MRGQRLGVPFLDAAAGALGHSRSKNARHRRRQSSRPRWAGNASELDRGVLELGVTGDFDASRFVVAAIRCAEARQPAAAHRSAQFADGAEGEPNFRHREQDVTARWRAQTGMRPYAVITTSLGTGPFRRYVVNVWARFSITAAISVTFACLATPAAAQVPLMSSIALTSTAGADALTVDFSGTEPAYQIVKHDDHSYDIVFQLARFAPKDRAPSRGSIVVVTPSQTAAAATLAVTASVPIVLQASRYGNRFTFIFQKLRSEAVPARTDSAVPVLEGETAELVYLKYADANEVLGMLGIDTSGSLDTSQITSPQNQSAPLMVPLGGGLAPQQTQLTPPLPIGSSSSGAQRVNEHIAINRRLNAVLLTGSPQATAALRERILLFDVPVPSITLEVKIVELTESAAKNVGISFASGGAIGTAGVQVQSFQKPSFELSLQAQILAQVENGGGRVVATPSIQALSGQSASILTGDAIPVVTNITYPGSPPTIQQQIQYINVGVQLQIQPRYSSDGFVTSRIMSQVSSVTAFLAGNIPQISQRQATTQATVRDGESYVIGGLVQENEICIASSPRTLLQAWSLTTTAQAAER